MSSSNLIIKNNSNKMNIDFILNNKKDPLVLFPGIFSSFGINQDNEFYYNYLDNKPKVNKVQTYNNNNKSNRFINNNKKSNIKIFVSTSLNNNTKNTITKYTINSNLKISSSLIDACLEEN